MWNFKPGDEVTQINDEPWYLLDGYRPNPVAPVFGAVYVVQGIELDGSEAYLVLEGFPGESWEAAGFRKVQRRDLTEWLAAENTINEPTRSPEMEPA